MVFTAIIEMYIFNNLFKDCHTFTNRHTRVVEAVVFTAIIEMYVLITCSETVKPLPIDTTHIS